MKAPSPPPVALAPSTARQALQTHWKLYVYEGAELAWFMVAACAGTLLLFSVSSPVLHAVPSAAVRRLLMGVAMGLTAVLIIHSPMGKRSGAHFNPAITLTYLRLGKIAPWDAMFYVAGQFAGAVFGVGAAALLLGSRLAQPSVEYAATVPGLFGTTGAFAAEFFMAILLMAVVLWTSNQPRLAHLTSYFVGVLIANYVFFFAPISGFSVNPARTTGSAVFARIWTALWVYFSAPLLGMFAAAEIFVRTSGKENVLCAKLHPDPSYLCPFLCHFPGHRHRRYAPNLPAAPLPLECSD